MPREPGAPDELSGPALLALVTRHGRSRQLDVGPGDLSAIESSVESRSVVFVCFDYSTNHGSIGLQEARQLVNVIRFACSAGAHLVFLFETSGIRVTDSTAGIASLRRVLREAVDARLAGLRMLALVLKSTFGGASLLASLCERRVIHNGCLFSMSGPKLMDPACDAEVARLVLNGRSRAQTSDGFLLVEPRPDQYVRAMRDWLAQAAPDPITLPRLAARTSSLATRLDESLPQAIPCTDLGGLPGHALHVLRNIFPRALELRRAGNVLLADAPGSDTRVVALFNRPGATATDALTLAREVADPSLRGSKHVRCVVLLDSESHASTLVDERVVLSEYLAHLALVIRLVARAGEVVDLVVTGHGGGGIQAALGCAASSVAMTQSARLFVLPQAAMRAIGKAEDAEAGSLACAMSVGAVDHPFP